MLFCSLVDVVLFFRSNSDFLVHIAEANEQNKNWKKWNVHEYLDRKIPFQLTIFCFLFFFFSTQWFNLAEVALHKTRASLFIPMFFFFSSICLVVSTHKRNRMNRCVYTVCIAVSAIAHICHCGSRMLNVSTVKCWYFGFEVKRPSPFFVWQRRGRKRCDDNDDDDNSSAIKLLRVKALII